MNNDQKLRALYFGAGLFIILFGVEKIIESGVANSTLGHYYKVNLIAGHLIDPEVACFGSSVGEVAINAKLIGQKTRRVVYNFCIDGTRFIQYNGLVKELNESASNCKLVIMAETSFSLSQVAQLTEPDRFIAHINNQNIYASLFDVQPGLARKMKYVPFYRFIVAKQRYYRAAATGLLQYRNRLSFQDSLSGFTPKDKGWEPGLDDLNRSTRPLEIIIDTAVLTAYKTTIKQLREKGREVLIIIPPIYKDGLRLLPDLVKIRTALSSLQGEGIYFRDYSWCEISNEKKYFYNNSHVNREGANVFSLKLATAVDSILSRAK